MRKTTEVRKIDESEIWFWYLTTNAKVYRVPKKVVVKCLSESKAIPEKEKRYLKPFLKNGRLAIKINNKQRSLGNLVVRTFSRKYRNVKRFCVSYKDGNKLNCKTSNLLVHSYKAHGKRTGYLSRSKPVKVKKKYSRESITYRSVREAAKNLHVSYQTLLDYIDVNKRPKNSVLKEYKISFL